MRLILLIFILIILSGCVLTTRPKDDVGFSNVSKIQQLAGCYRNLADGGASGAKQYLTRFIWPENDTDHKGIGIVRVVKLSDHSLKVSGENNNKVLREEVFTEGKISLWNPGK